MATWRYSTTDINGKRYTFKVKASSKPEAIKAGRDLARAKAPGGYLSGGWDCTLIKA